MRTQKETRRLIDEQIQEIKKLAERHIGYAHGTAKEFDGLARDMKAHTDCIKDLAYSLTHDEEAA